MAEIYYLPRKTFTDRADGRLHQDTEKVLLSPNSAQRIDRRKAAPDQVKSKLRTACKVLYLFFLTRVHAWLQLQSCSVETSDVIGVLAQ